MPSPLPNASQVINAKQWDWSSIIIQIEATPFGGVKGLDWDHGLTPGEGQGTRAQLTMRSRGKYRANGSIEMYEYEYLQTITALSAGGVRGYMEVPFLITCQYKEDDLPMQTHYLNYCRILKEGRSKSEDGGIFTVKADLHIMSVIPCIPGTTTPLFAVTPSKFVR